jgi:hypothetical protein
MHRYLNGVADRHGVQLGVVAGAETVQEPASVRALPSTALKGLGRWLEDLPPLRARCLAALPVGNDLRLVIHEVDPAGTT